MPKGPVAAVILLALGLGPALAQAPAGGAFLTEAPNTLPLSKIRGLGVIGLDHTRVGSIDEVLIGRDGRVESVVIGVGGFLGLGEKRVAVPFNQVLWNTGEVKPTDGPRASTAPNAAGSAAETPPPRPERMPGAQVSNEVLATTAENRSGAVTPATGPAAPASPAPDAATVPVVAAGGSLTQAQVRMTRADLDQAPAFEMRR